MHVGMKKIVLKYLRKKGFDAFVCQHFKIYIGRAQRFNLTDRYAVYTFHNQQVMAGMLAVKPWHI